MKKGNNIFSILLIFLSLGSSSYSLHSFYHSYDFRKEEVELFAPSSNESSYFSFLRLVKNIQPSQVRKFLLNYEKTLRLIRSSYLSKVELKTYHERFTNSLLPILQQVHMRACSIFPILYPEPIY